MLVKQKSSAKFETKEQSHNIQIQNEIFKKKLRINFQI